VNKDAAWLISPDVRATYSEDGAVLLDIRRGSATALIKLPHEYGSQWNRARRNRPPWLVDVMETHYKVSREQLQGDIAEYLSKLEQMGLVQRNACSPGPRPAGSRG